MSTDEDKLRHRLAEMMSSAGLGYNSISLEILYLLPTEFVSLYIQLWESAMGPAGGGDAPGRQRAGDAALGKASGALKRSGGKREGGAIVQAPHVQGGGKKWKPMGLSVRDEYMFALKARIDRRLRSIARDIEGELELSPSQRRKRARNNAAGTGPAVGMGPDLERDGTEGLWRCPACGKIGDRAWTHCPYDGSIMILIRPVNG